MAFSGDQLQYMTLWSMEPFVGIYGFIGVSFSFKGRNVGRSMQTKQVALLAGHVEVSHDMQSLLSVFIVVSVTVSIEREGGAQR